MSLRLGVGVVFVRVRTFVSTSEGDCRRAVYRLADTCMWQMSDMTEIGRTFSDM